MKLNSPDDDDESGAEAGESVGEAGREVRVTDPVTTEEVPVEEGLESVVSQMYDELNAVDYETDALEMRLSALEDASDRRDHAVAELQAGFESLAEREGFTVEFEHDLRDP